MTPVAMQCQLRLHHACFLPAPGERSTDQANRCTILSWSYMLHISMQHPWSSQLSACAALRAGLQALGYDVNALLAEIASASSSIASGISGAQSAVNGLTGAQGVSFYPWSAEPSLLK